MPRPSRPSPRDALDDWDGRTTPPAARINDLPPDLAVLIRFATSLRAAIGNNSVREIGRTTGVDFTVIARILSGQAWPEMQTIARLEAGLDADLWPAGTARQAAINNDQ